VSDTRGLPIHNAVTVLEFPELGASAHFVDGSQVKVALTDSRGQATFRTVANNIPGKYQPRITVNYLDQTSSLVLSQENAYPYAAAHPANRRHFSKKKILLISGAAALAVLGLAATHGSGGGTSQSGITITPGTGTVGGNH
jgi:hypothetical protein